MHFINWGSESPEQLAARRRIEEQALYEQAARMAQAKQRAGQAPGVAGGSKPKTNPKAVKISAKNNTIGYYDDVTGNLVFFNADWDAVSFSETADTGIPYADIDGWYFDEMIDGKGVLVRVTMNNSDRYYIFIDAGCNIIETVHLIYNSAYGTGANRSSTEGIGIQLCYRNETEGRVVKWWNGDKIFTYRDNNTINSNDSRFYTNWYNYDSAFADGTGSVSIYDNELDKDRIFHTRPNGQFLEVTDSYYIDGTEPSNSNLHCVGDFAILSYEFVAPIITTTGSYETGSYTVTLNAPIPTLRRGMEIESIGTGDFDNGVIVTEISNGGLELTVSAYPNNTNSDAVVQFSGTYVDTLRVMSADGTYTDFDISEHDAQYTQNDSLFGSDKAVFSLYRNFDNKLVYIIYNHSTGLLSSSIPIDYLNYDNWYNHNIKNNFYSSVASVAGCEKFLGAQLGNQSYDGKMWRYEDLTFIWSNPFGDVFTYTFDTSAGTVGFKQADYSYGDPLYVIINSPGSSDLEIMFFNDYNGSVLITPLGTTYNDWTGYLQYGALGDKTWISWKDDSRILPDNKIQAFTVFANGITPADQIWVTESNNGAQIGKTQFISQFDEGVTYLFNYALNEYYTINDLIDTWTQFRWNSYQNAIDFEVLSNVVLFPPDNSFYLVNPSYTPPVRVDDGGYLAFKGSSDYAVKLSEDDSPEGFIRISVYNYEGTLVNSVLTQAATYFNFEVVNERIFLSQNPTGDTWHFYIITPEEDGYVFKEITAPNGFQYFVNSWGWWY